MTPIANNVKLSTAAVGACDEPIGAVVNSGLAAMIDFTLTCPVLASGLHALNW